LVPERIEPTRATLKLAAAAALLAGGIWSYWPTLANLIETWSTVPDYSHGFLVVPFAILFLWVRRATFPGLAETAPWLALGLLAASLAVRQAGVAFFFTFMDGWSLVPWVAALVALLGGRSLLAWAWPSVVFLIFMVPLPFSIEYELSGPLQRIATIASTAVLQFLGQPAFAEGNRILLGDMKPLEVAQACSGLRLFVGIVALTYVYVAMISRPWWEKMILIAAAAPIAIAANVARIVATGLLYQVVPASSHEVIHNYAGLAMALFAALLFSLLLWYLRVLVKEERVMDMSAVVKQCRA
jgi:exosortase